MKTNPWLLVLILIESETVPTKKKTMQSRASLIAGYYHISTSFLHNHKSRKTSQNKAKNIFIETNNVAEIKKTEL